MSKIAFVHYGIGDRDGVNNVMRTNALEFLKKSKKNKVYFVGFFRRELITSYKDRVKYIDIPELNVLPKAKEDLSNKDVFAYIRKGMNLFTKLEDALKDMDSVIIENPNIGIHPAATYAFYRFVKRNFQRRTKRKIIYRIHDFAEDRRGNFINILKFRGNETCPYWHKVVFPSVGNLSYVVVNKKDLNKLRSHGILAEGKPNYVPNPIDENLYYEDKHTSEGLRNILIKDHKLDKDVKFIFYPVRIVPRKNVEEAIFLTALLNKKLDGKYVLVVSLRSRGPVGEKYYKILNDFVKKNNLPVILSVHDHVALERVYTKDKKIKMYGVGDMYNICDKVITTSLLEGFGMFFVESWYFDKAIIGRDLPDITSDFKTQGINLEHLYTTLFVNKSDFRNHTTQERLQFVKKLNNKKFFEEFSEENKHAIAGLLDLFDPKEEKRDIRENRKVVMKNFTSRKIANRLLEILRNTKTENIIKA